MQFDDREVGDLLGAILRARTSSAKDLANRIGIDERSAKEYRAGRQVPRLAKFLAILNTLGDDIADTLRDPHAARARLDEDVKELERELARKRALRDAAGPVARSATRVARHEDRPSAQVAAPPGGAP